MTENRENNTPERQEASSERTEVKDMSNGELLKEHGKDDGKKGEIETKTGEKALGEYKKVVEKHNKLQREIDRAKEEKGKKVKEVSKIKYGKPRAIVEAEIMERSKLGS